MAQFFKRYWLRLAVLFVAVGLSAALLLTIFLSGKITADLSGNKLHLKAYYVFSKPFSESVIVDLTNYSLGKTDYFFEGEMVFGHEYSKVKAGKYLDSTTKSEHMLYKYNSVKTVIVLRSKDGEYTLVFNLKTKEKTEEFYTKLSQIML